jgi:hypothetical protein
MLGVMHMKPMDLLVSYSGPCGLIKFMLVIAFSAFLFAYLPIKIITPYMNRLFKPESSLSCTSDQSEVVGIIERVLYIILIVTDLQYIIIGWFALKALQNPFKETNAEDPEKMSKKYHTIVTGNGLSLLFGVIGGVLTKQILYSIVQ